jgi:hypothetical protein
MRRGQRWESGENFGIATLVLTGQTELERGWRLFR